MYVIDTDTDTDQIQLERLYFLRDLTYVLNANIYYDSIQDNYQKDSDILGKMCHTSIIFDVPCLGGNNNISKHFFEPLKKILETDHISQLEEKYENILYSSTIEKNYKNGNGRGRIILNKQDLTLEDLECIVELAFIKLLEFTSNDWKEEMKTLGNKIKLNHDEFFPDDTVCSSKDIRRNIDIEIAPLENKILIKTQIKLLYEIEDLKYDIVGLKDFIDYKF